MKRKTAIKIKVGIMTFWQTNENYGQLLQACALQIFLEGKGYHPFIIRYDKTTSVNKYKPGLRQRMRSVNWSRLLDLPAVLRKVNMSVNSVPPAPFRYFDDFSADFIRFHPKIYYTPEELCASPPEADVYITGSDQVWNYKYTGDCEPFFLTFGPPHVRRLSYAASFGHKTLPSHISKKYRDCLQHLDAVSVGEISGVALCHQLGRKNVRVMPDPTLLVSKEQWTQYCSEAEPFRSSQKRKVLIYTLGNRSSDAKEDLISYVSSLQDTETVHISINKDFSGRTHATIPEWLGYFKNADLVITNSYHGTIFSILFNKNFITIACSGDKAEMNERPITLLQKAGLEDHLLYSFQTCKVQELIHRSHDWALINSRIEEWRRDADRFLELGQGL